MLNVLHIISDTNIGGAGVHLLTFLANYDRNRLAVRALCPPESLLIERCRALDTPVYTSPFLAADRSFGWSGLAGLRREIGAVARWDKLNLIHTHASFAGRLAAKTLGTPCIVYTKHRQDWDPGQAWAKRQAVAYLNRFTCHHAIAVSQGVKQDLVAGGLPEKMVTVIYNGVDGARLRELAGPDSGGEAPPELAGKRVVGMVARLAPEKGHRYLLNAADEILSAHPDVVFLIVGAGALEDNLKDLALSLGIGKQVLFTGYQENAAKWINLMDILVIPSLTEAFGITLLEGMCLGKPCVASDVGGLAEIAGVDREAVCLVPPSDAASLAKRINYLLAQPEAAQAMGERGAKVAEAKFSAKKMADEITDLYYRLT